MNLILLLALLGFQPTVVEASVISPITVEWSTTTAPLIVNAYAYKYGVSFEEMWATIQCENRQLNPRALGDHGLARGIAQIRSDYHPEITDEQAFDPFFSVEFMASYFAKGQAKQWTCWRTQFGGKGV